MAENITQSLIGTGQYTAEISGNSGPPDSALGEYYCRLLIGKYTRTKPFEPQTWQPNLSIFLPIPAELMDETPVNLSDKNLESVGDIMNTDITGVGSIALKGSGELISAVSGAAITAGLGSAAGKIANSIAKVGGVTSENITSAIQQSVGLAPNPNPSVQFTGPSLRELNFSWVFYPKTPEESLNIDKMIRQLKSSALPSNTFAAGTAVLNYPDLCQINFFPWDSGGTANTWGWNPNKSIIRIKKCFIKNVRVSYSEQGNPAFFHNTQLPIMYKLSLSLQETEYMLSKDWGGNKWTDAITGDEILSATLESIGTNAGVFGVTVGTAVGVANFTAALLAGDAKLNSTERP